MQEEDEDSDGYVNDQMLEEVEPKILFYQRSYCTVEDAMQFLQYKGNNFIDEGCFPAALGEELFCRGLSCYCSVGVGLHVFCSSVEGSVFAVFRGRGCFTSRCPNVRL